MYFILYFTLLIFSFFEFVFRKTSLPKFFFLLVAVLFIIMISFSTGGPDLENYQNHFYNNDLEYIRNALEPMHLFLIDTSKKIGFSFEEFYAIYGVLIMIPFLYFIKKNSPLPIFVLSVFFVIPFFPDITQIRNFLAISVFFIAIHYYKKSKIIFYILYFISILCHYSMLSIIPFLIIRRFSFFHNLKLSYIIIIVGMLLLMLVPRSISDPLITAINPKYNVYLEGTGTYLGTIILFLPFFTLNSLVLYHYKNIYQQISWRIDDKYRQNLPFFIELILYANYLILLQYFIRDFSRITMNLSILSYIYISITIFYGWTKKRNVILSNLQMLILILWSLSTFYIIFLALNGGEYFKVIENIFSKNSIYGSKS